MYEPNCNVVIMLQIHFLHKSLISAILSNDERFTPDFKICIKIKYILFQTKLVNFPSIYINSKQTSTMFACKLFLFQRIHLFIFHSIKMVLGPLSNRHLDCFILQITFSAFSFARVQSQLK